MSSFSEVWSDFISWMGTTKGQVALAGALGGVVRSITLRENWRDGLLTLITGAVCATYLTPLVMPVLEPTLGKLVIQPDALSTFSGFVVGIGGMAVAGFVIDIWTARRRAVHRSNRQRAEDQEASSPSSPSAPPTEEAP